MTIPDDWTISTVEQLCHFENNRRIPVSESERAKRPGDVPYYGANGLQGYIDSAIFNEDLILLAEDGGHYDDFASRPIAYRITGPSWVNNHAHVIRSRDPDFQDFLFYSLEHKDIRANIVGGTRGKLNLGQLKNIQIAHPVNVSESIAIAEIIQLADNATTFQRQLIDKLEMIREGLISDLMNCRDCGEQCNCWEMHRLSDITTHIVDCPHDTPKYIEAGIPVVRTPDIRNGILKIEQTRRVSNDTYLERISRLEPAARDIILTREAPVGEACMIPENTQLCMGQRMVLIRCDENLLLPEFLLVFLCSSRFRQWIYVKSAGTTNPHLNVSEIRNLPINIPSTIQEQRQIVEPYISITNRIEVEKINCPNFNQ